jgi:CsoR family transcriptional regulator, copper-sensing transcriptional repressor
MNNNTKKIIAARLKRIEGQVRGVNRMVADDRYCIDVLTQISALCAALHRIEQEILKDHLSCCVAGAFKRGDTKQQQEKIGELIDVLSKITR